MDWPRLDASSWNLSLGAVAASMLAGCGPLVVLEGETDTDSVTDTDPSPTEPSETDTTPWGPCNGSNECPPGYDCIGNVCMPYDYYCQDGGCCYGGTGGCCYYDCCYGDCYYSECYSDAECGPQEICSNDYGYGQCEYVAPLPECGDFPEVVPLVLPDTDEGFVWLSFVDANGDAAQDLVMGGAGRAQLQLGPGEVPPIDLPVPPDVGVGEAVAGDFDGDGDTDLVLATDIGRLLVIDGDGAGGWALSNDQAISGYFGNMVALQWNGDGTLDLAGTDESGNVLVLRNAGDGTFPEIGVLPTSAPVNSLARTDLGGDGYGDLVAQEPGSAPVFLGDFSGDYTVDFHLPGTVHGYRTLVSGPMAGGAPYEVIGHTAMPGWRLLELWNDVLVGPYRAALPLGLETQFVELGDLDGDAVQDVVLGAGETVTYVHAAADGFGGVWLDCQSTYSLGGPYGVMAVGDFDGNGRADIAYDGFGGPVVLLVQ
jgi:hypothetical protein